VLGWWKEGNAVLGDEPFESALEFLEKVSRAYEDDFARKPTLDEILRQISDALRVAGYQYVADLETIDVVSIAAKTRRRSRRQAATLGDYFLIPLTPSGFGYARLVWQDTLGDFVDIFDCVTSSERTLGPASEAPVLFSVYVESRAWEDREWINIGGHSNYNPKAYRHPGVLLRSISFGLMRVWDGKKERPASSDKDRNLEPAQIWPGARIGWRIAAMKGLVTMSDVRKMLRSGKKSAALGDQQEARTMFGLAAQYLQWIPNAPDASKLRAEALELLKPLLPTHVQQVPPSNPRKMGRRG